VAFSNHLTATEPHFTFPKPSASIPIMRNLTAILGITITVLLGSISVRAAPLTIEETKFFVRFSTWSSDGSIITQELDTNSVPLIPKRICYGWGVKVSTDAKLIKFREEFSLPSEPKYWSGENNEFATNSIINKRQTSITTQFAAPDKGWIKHGWCVAKGDPEGDYSMRVYFNDRFIKKFDFEVRKPKEKN
jgi:hypothetical protein